MQARNPNNAKGIDVSHYQGNVDWAKVKSAGYSFAICKATEGRYMVDDFLKRNIDGCNEHGLAVSAYHFCRASNVEEAIVEAKFFCDTLDSVGGILALDFLPVLDIETAEAKNRQTVTAVCHAWLEYVEKRIGVAPMIYADRSFIDDYLDPSLSKYKLWLAAYGTDQPTDRNGWSQWEFIQVSDSGQVPGVVGNVDINEFRGTVEELMHKLSVEDANKINALLGGIYNAGFNQEEAHRLANEVRKASGQPTT